MLLLIREATDDHLMSRSISGSKLYQSSIIRGYVSSSPTSHRGGVVRVEISDHSGKITAVAMEPTREFRQIILKLRKGDEVRVYGGITREGFINLEKIEIISLSTVKVESPPFCGNCGTKMESLGRNRGFRCRKCGGRSNRGDEWVEGRKLKEGMYEVPILARRHLSRPLKLGDIK